MGGGSVAEEAALEADGGHGADVVAGGGAELAGDHVEVAGVREVGLEGLVGG